jgi:hypothetical protein
MSDSKRCFVIMGFGTKTDLATGRKLNLDKSYNALIKPVVVEKGLACIRGDEILHSGEIDLPMYQELLTADVVIADISTANANAFYELGLRHALRPRTTIIISEDQLSYPFDLNHILIRKYTHLGENIDYFEVMRFQKLLGDTLESVLKSQSPDSPIYTFLDNLIPPSLQRKAENVARQVNAAIKAGDTKDKGAADTQTTMSLIVKQAEQAMEAKQYTLAKSFFNTALLMLNSNTKDQSAADSYLIHRLAYATYKAKEPDVTSALKESIKILSQLDLAHTNDAETVILAGRIEKKLYFDNQGEEHLANAVQYFERGNFLLNNRFNGINLAFLLNCRVESTLFNTVEDKIADIVVANRIRRSVLAKCEAEWKKLSEENTDAEKQLLAKDDQLAADQKAIEQVQRFWIQVNKAEAYFGLGEMDNYKKALETAQAIEHTDWMIKAFEEQRETLGALLKKHGHLMNPAWKEA